MGSLHTATPVAGLAACVSDRNDRHNAFNRACDDGKRKDLTEVGQKAEMSRNGSDALTDKRALRFW